MNGHPFEDLTPDPAPPLPSVAELARIAAALPIAQTDPQHAVRQAYGLWEAAAVFLEEKSTFSELQALAAEADLAPYIPLEEAMQRTGHKKVAGFYQRALTLVPNLAEGWIGEHPDAEGFDPATTRVHSRIVEIIQEADRAATAARKRRHRRAVK